MSERSTNPKLRWWQFSLRRLIVLVLMASLLAAIGTHVHRVGREYAEKTRRVDSLRPIEPHEYEALAGLNDFEREHPWELTLIKLYQEGSVPAVIALLIFAAVFVAGVSIVVRRQFRRQN